jgi:1-phosphofructokinase
MIYTVTFSPALDYIVDLDKLDVGAINRTKKETMLPGGKGINVSLVLSNLKTKSVAMGFVGGFIGKYIEDEMKAHNIESDFVHLNGNTRINVKIKGMVETAINGQGPKVESKDIETLINKLTKLTSKDVLVISGAIPNTLPSDTYERILERIKDQHVQLIVDTTKDTLLKTLPYHPVLVKPNKEELEELFNVKINNDEELVTNAKRLIELGAQNVIVSLGGDGALLVQGNGEYKITRSPKGKVINTVGAGDSLVAGFIDEYYRSGDINKAFKRGIACGSASAFSENLATLKKVEELEKLI